MLLASLGVCSGHVPAQVCWAAARAALVSAKLNAQSCNCKLQNNQFELKHMRHTAQNQIAGAAFAELGSDAASKPQFLATVQLGSCWLEDRG